MFLCRWVSETSGLHLAVAIAYACVAACASAAVPAHAQVAGEVRGRVTDAITLQVVPHAVIEIRGQASAVRTASDGKYAIRGIVPAAYTISVRALGYAAQSREISISNGRLAIANFELAAQAVQLGEVAVNQTREIATSNAIRYSRADIEQSGLRDVGEMLRLTPGVNVTETGGAGRPSQISIRGSSSNQVLVLFDGVPQNSATSGAADLSRLSLENVETIVVRTGAQSARYGPRAMAGAIEVTSRRATHELSSALRAGSQGEQNASVMAARTMKVRATGVSATAGADLRHNRGDFLYPVPAVRGGGRARRINSGSTARQLQGGLTVGSEQSGLSLRGVWQQSNRGMAGTIVQPSSTGKQEHSRLSAGAGAQGRARGIAWTTLADVTREAGVFADTNPPFGVPFNDSLRTTGTSGAISLDYSRRSVGVMAGADARALDVRSTMLTSDAPHWQRQLGVWASTRAHRDFSSNVALHGELSARLDHSSLTDEQEFSPRAAIHATSSVLAATVSVGSGFAPATIADQYFHEGVQTRANPNLRAERTRRDVEGRLLLREQSLGGLKFSGEAAAFRADIDGMILWLPNFQYVWSPSNYNVTRSGWELSAGTRWPTARLELHGTLNRSDVKYAGGALSGQVAYRPNTTANVALSANPKRVHLQLSGRYVGTRRTIAGSALNSLAPFGMFDARVSTSLALGGWVLSPALAIENATNREASMLADYPLPPRVWSISLRVRQSSSHSR